MKYQEKIFFTSQDIPTNQDVQGAELKSVANDPKYMFQVETVKKLKLEIKFVFILEIFISEYSNRN